jgi:hypothetical protein
MFPIPVFLPSPDSDSDPPTWGSLLTVVAILVVMFAVIASVIGWSLDREFSGTQCYRVSYVTCATRQARSVGAWLHDIVFDPDAGR